MKKKKMLIAQIGRGNYLPTVYGMLVNEVEKEDERMVNEASLNQTGYTFEAVLHELDRRIKKNGDTRSKAIDTVVLIGTTTSYWGSLCSYYMRGSAPFESEEEIEAMKTELQEALKTDSVSYEVGKRNTEQGIQYAANYSVGALEGEEGERVKEEIERVLTTALREKYKGIGVKILLLKKGVSKGELSDNFKSLQEGLQDIVESYYESGGNDAQRQGGKYEIQMYLDISNGFRSLPMHIYNVTNYLARLREEKYKLYMYYGMADAKAKYGKTEQTIAPLVEMNEVTDLMQWINAVNEFRNFGSVRELRRIFQTNEEWDIEIPGSQYKKLSELFDMFDYSTNSHNLYVLEHTIKALSRLEELPNWPGYEQLPSQAALLLEDIGRDFKTRFDTSGRYEEFEFGKLTISLAEWFCDQGRLGSASIALTEGMITYMMERFQGMLYINGNDGTFGLPSGRGARRRKIRWLFDYKNRELPKKYIGSQLEVSREVRDYYWDTRNEIRNTGAHFSYERIAEGAVRNYRNMISVLLKEVKDDMEREDRDSIFYTAAQSTKEKLEQSLSGTEAE